MSEKNVLTFIKDINRRIQHDGISPGQAYEAIKQEYESLIPDNNVLQPLVRALDTALEQVESKIKNIERLSMVHSVRDRPEQWYPGAQPDEPGWGAYSRHLVEKGWEDTIGSIDESSNGVVSLLHCPGLPKFSGRGLVLGYVQSGKTANMTAVIAKAADAGYRLIIVLTGMIEKLRKQTQLRLETDLLDHEDAGQWYPWTTLEDDFKHPTTAGFQFNREYRNIMIVKKNASVLRRLLNKLENTPRLQLERCPVLIIDDECDQASVNGPGPRNDWTAINRNIRQILGQFPKASYVGYTATPFANVLIDPSIDPSRPDDLYPRDFIYSLPRPDSYFGAERLFGRDPLEADVEPDFDEELDIIRTVPDDEISLLRPTGRNRDSFAEITLSLIEAMNYFLIATATRELRGERSAHSTMLIHTSQKIDDHSQIYSQIAGALALLAHKIGRRESAYKKELNSLWSRESEAVPPALFGNSSTSFEEIWKILPNVVKDIEVVVENSKSDTARIDYESAEEDHGRRYICIGGNVLARGLTLEGLVTSYFVRTARQYDTLMQMGRWFGYRKGYEDLPRVWMTSEMQDSFKALATVEAEIRYQIEHVYREKDLTPMDVAVRIRQIPGLAITAKNKMLSAQKFNLSFAGEHRQTIRFKHRDQGVLERNWRAGSKLVNRALECSEVEKRKQGPLIRGVSRALVEEFLHGYSIHEGHPDLVDDGGQTNHLLEYVVKCKERDPDALKRWNLGIIQARTGSRPDENISLGRVDGLKTIVRSKFQTLDSGDADIKALMSRSDIRIDIDEQADVKDDWQSIKEARLLSESSNCPLLLLYIIDKESAPKQVKGSAGGSVRKSRREPLNAVDHVLGFGIVFPSSDDDLAGSYEVAVRLPDLDDAEEEEAFNEESEELS